MTLATPPTRESVQERERLRRALDSYAADDLRAMLEWHSPGAGASRRKAERIEQLVEILTDPEAARRGVGGLSPLARRLLAIVKRYRRTSLAALALAGPEPGSDERAVREELERLLARGLLLVEEREPGSKAVLTLEEPPALLRWTWAPLAVLEALPAGHGQPGNLAPAGAQPARVEEGSFTLLRRDLYLMLRELKGGGLRLTRTGEPHRTDLRRLLAATEPGQRRPARGTTSAGESRLLFLLRLLLEAGLVRAAEDQLTADAESEVFLQAPELAAARRLHESWLNMPWDEFGRIPTITSESWAYQGSVDRPNRATLEAARRSIGEVLAAWAQQDVAGEWVAVDAIADALRRSDPEFLIPRLVEPAAGYAGSYRYPGQATGYYYTWQAQEQGYYRGLARADARGRERRLRKDQDWQEVEGAFVAQVLGEPLRWLGLVDVGYDGSGDRPAVVRLTELGAQLFGAPAETDEPVVERATLVVQPSFEVLVLDALANLELLSRLDAFAEPKSLDRAAVYRLTRAALVRGLASGWTVERVVATLEAGARAPIPQNVRRSLHDWAGDYERIHLHRRATILEVADPAALEAWLADPDLAPLLDRRLTPTVALLRPVDPATLDALLDRHDRELGVTDYAVDDPQVLDLDGPGQLVVSPLDDEPYLRYQLARFADRLPAGPRDSDGAPGDRGRARAPARYAITPVSLARARDHGMSIDDVLSFLGFKARVGLTPDDVLTLRGWAGYYEPFRYERVRAVELPPAANWGDLTRVKALRPLIHRVINASLALIREEDWPRLEAALAERGIGLAEGAFHQAAAPRREAALRVAGAVGLATGRDLAARSKLRTDVPLRRLNGRALTDFVEEALDAQAPLVIEYRQPTERRSTVRTIEPRGLEVRGGAYYLRAFCHLRQEERTFRLANIRGVARAAT